MWLQAQPTIVLAPHLVMVESIQLTPQHAHAQALRRAGLTQADIDYWEVNQAFSVVDLVNQRLLGLDPATVNVHGGSVALGAQGARWWRVLREAKKRAIS